MIRVLARRWPWLRPFLPAAVLAAGRPARIRGERPLVGGLGASRASGRRLFEERARPALVAGAPASRHRQIRAVDAGRSGATPNDGAEPS